MTERGAYLGVYFGCMFAGKSRRLIETLSEFYDLGLNVAYVTHTDDNRETAGVKCHITTHWSAFSKADMQFDCYKTTSLRDLLEKLIPYDAIGIDEFQFFDYDAIEVVKSLVEDHNKILICAGLDSNFRREKFGHILDLIPLASEVYKIYAVCEMCRRKNLPFGNRSLIRAEFTAKIGGDLSVERETGGADKYIPLCRHHYTKHMRA